MTERDDHLITVKTLAKMLAKFKGRTNNSKSFCHSVHNELLDKTLCFDFFPQRLWKRNKQGKPYHDIKANEY